MVAVSSPGTSPFFDVLALYGLPPTAMPAPDGTTPAGMPDADAFMRSQAMLSALFTASFLGMSLDQDLLALLITYFEQKQREQSLTAGRDLGGMSGANRRFSNPPQRTSWSPGQNGSSAPSFRPPATPGRPAAVDTRAPAGFEELPRGENGVGRFLDAALAQNGDEYEYGAGRNLNNDNPSEFDCSGLVFWACNQAGIDPNTIGGYSGAQSANTRSISTEEALRTPGALLFKPGHVAISLGDGRTIEAMGERWGVTVDQDATDRGWTHGGLIPNMDYGGSIGVVA